LTREKGDGCQAGNQEDSTHSTHVDKRNKISNLQIISSGKRPDATLLACR
jgi:hypothetical protein